MGPKREGSTIFKVGDQIRIKLWYRGNEVAINKIFDFFLSGFSFTKIHDSQESRGRGRLFLSLFSTTSTRFI